VNDRRSLDQLASALAQVVESRLPLDVDVTGSRDAWPMIGPALLTHATASLKSIFVLRQHQAHNDASRLLRSLYDHVVTFAWLAADPSVKRIDAWQRSDFEQRLRMDREFTSVGSTLLDADMRISMEREIDQIPTTAPDLASKALVADDFWEPRIDALGVDEFGSFRGLYTILFRQHSGLVHSTYRGLNHVIEHVSPTGRRVVLETSLGGRGPYGMAVAVYGLALLVAAQAIGWSSADDVEALFASYDPAED
jgi:hypothetical protein